MRAYDRGVAVSARYVGRSNRMDRHSRRFDSGVRSLRHSRRRSRCLGSRMAPTNGHSVSWRLRLGDRARSCSTDNQSCALARGYGSSFRTRRRSCRAVCEFTCKQIKSVVSNTHSVHTHGAGTDVPHVAVPIVVRDRSRYGFRCGSVPEGSVPSSVLGRTSATLRAAAMLAMPAVAAVKLREGIGPVLIYVEAHERECAPRATVVKTGFDV
jgi:hypothetical protein